MLYCYREGSEELTQLLEDSVAIGVFESISLQAWNSSHKMTAVNPLPKFKPTESYRTDSDLIKNNTSIFMSISTQ